jgi:hypothetical protein
LVGGVALPTLGSAVCTLEGVADCSTGAVLDRGGRNGAICARIACRSGGCSPSILLPVYSLHLILLLLLFTFGSLVEGKWVTCEVHKRQAQLSEMMMRLPKRLLHDRPSNNQPDRRVNYACQWIRLESHGSDDSNWKQP